MRINLPLLDFFPPFSLGEPWAHCWGHPGRWRLDSGKLPSLVKKEAKSQCSLESAWPFLESQLRMVPYREPLAPGVAIAGVLSSYCKMEAAAAALYLNLMNSGCQRLFFSQFLA